MGRIMRKGVETGARLVMAVAGVFGPIGLALAVLVVVLFTAYLALLTAIQPVGDERSLALSEARALAAGHAVMEATVYDEDARVVLTTKDNGRAWVAYPKSDSQTGALIDALEAGGARVEVDQQSTKAVVRFLVQYLFPLVILAALFGLVFVVTSGKGGAAEFAAFSKLRSRKHGALGANRITFDQVAGAREAVVELREIVDYLKDPGRYAALGARAPKGVLLVGPPGTGKTLLARAVAGEAGVPFFSLSGSEFVESLVGVGAARVRDLFRQARETAPAIIFIDELDAAGRQRGAGMGQGNDEREQTLNQMLVEMDGFSATSGIAVLGATNRPDILDPALLRPGRFDRQVVVDAPDVEGRAEILALYLQGRPMAPGVTVESVARQTPGFTGAELANLVNEAALVAIRQGRATIEAHDLEEAVDRVVAGPQRRSHVLSAEEKRMVAYHEAGHAVVAKALAVETGVQKLSIVARGRSLGHTTTYSLTDRIVLTEADLRRQLITTMGGPASEQAVFGQITTGSEGDLHSATALARSMVANLGMGETLGRVAVAHKSGEVFLGRDFSKMQEVSPATLEAVDREIGTLLQRAEAEAAAVIEENLAVVHELVAALVEVETLSGRVLDELLDRVRTRPEPLGAVWLREPAGKSNGRAPARTR